MCVDYLLSKLIKKEIFLVLTFKEAKLFKFFSCLDLKIGYFQIWITSESRKFITFITTDGLYEFKLLPFGLKTAPVVFNRLMVELQK